MRRSIDTKRRCCQVVAGVTTPVRIYAKEVVGFRAVDMVSVAAPITGPVREIDARPKRMIKDWRKNAGKDILPQEKSNLSSRK